MSLSKLSINILLVFLCSTCLLNQAFSKSNSTLADSIYHQINSSNGDTLIFDDIFKCVMKNRRNLGEDYLPLMHAYLHNTEKYSYDKGAMEIMDRIGLQYRYDEVYDSALIYHNRALEFAKQIGDSIQLYYTYTNLGQVYRMQDLSVKAIQYFHQALTVTQALGIEKSSSYAMNCIGAAYMVQKDYDQAMSYFRSSANIAIELNDKRTLAYNYGSIGEIYLNREQNDSAMQYFVDSKKLIVELGRKRGYGVAEHLIGQAHFALNNIDSAEQYFKKALYFHENNKSKRYQALCYAYMGQIKIKQHKADSSEWYLNKGKKAAESIHSYENLILIYNALHELYKQNENWEEAITALKQSYNYQDSIIDISKNNEIQAIELGYQTKQKEQQIKLLSAENEIKNQRMKIAWILIILLVLSISVGVYVQRMRKKQSELSEEKLKQQLMLSQMNPHFIFNALGSIQGFMYKNEAKKAASYLGNFAALTRAILNNSTLEQTSLESELDTLRNYIELENMRMQSAFSYFIVVPEEIDVEFIQIPPMLLQPFVENAIKHGFRDKETAGELRLVVNELNDLISVEITDNGIGINSTLNTQDSGHKSMATKIFRQRMNILQKRYANIPDPQIIDISDKENNLTGTKVLVFLPIMND